MVVDFFKKFFWNFEFDKNDMTSNMLCFTMMSLLISQLSWNWMESEQHESLFYLPRSWLSLNGTSVLSFWSQKLSFTTNISRSVFLEPCRLTSLSIMMSSACLLKLIPCSWKYLKARTELGFLVSFLWLFNLRLNAVSAFLTYCILHNMQAIW